MKSVFKKISLLIILMSMVQMLSAQIGYRHNVVPSALPDSLDLAYYGKKYFGWSAATVVGLNLGVWAFDRYVRNQDYAQTPRFKPTTVAALHPKYFLP